MEHLWSYLCRVIDEVSKCNLPLNTKEDRVLRSKAELSVETPFLKLILEQQISSNQLKLCLLDISFFCLYQL